MSELLVKSKLIKLQNLVLSQKSRSAKSGNIVIVYTDGACTGNPGKGGYGVVIIDGDRRQKLSKGYKLTTNNRMEMMGAIALKLRIQLDIQDNRFRNPLGHECPLLLVTYEQLS